MKNKFFSYRLKISLSHSKLIQKTEISSKRNLFIRLLTKVSSKMSQISLLSSLNPLTKILQLTAFMLFTIDSKTGKIKYTKINFIIGFFAIIFQFVVHYIFWTSYFNFGVMGTEIIKFGVPKLIYANLASYGLTRIWLFIQRHEIAKTLEKISKIDEKLEDLYCKIDYKESSKMLRILVALIIFFVITLFTLALCIPNLAQLEITPIISIFHLEGFTSSGLIVLQVLLALHAIKKRFGIINQQISTKNLKKLAEVHFETTNLIESFNQVFGFVMMMCTTIVFGWFCMFVFSLVMASSNLIKFPFLMAFDAVINSIIIGSFVMIIFFAESAKGEGRKTVKLLYMELHKIEDQKISSNIQNFIHQIVNTKNEFSCGLFDLNWAFLFKVSKFFDFIIFKKKLQEHFISVSDNSCDVFCNFGAI